MVQSAMVILDKYTYSKSYFYMLEKVNKKLPFFHSYKKPYRTSLTPCSYTATPPPCTCHGRVFPAVCLAFPLQSFTCI